jgi:hypothetical protein
MHGYNDRFTEQVIAKAYTPKAIKLIKIINFLSELCPLYEFHLEINKNIIIKI